MAGSLVVAAAFFCYGHDLVLFPRQGTPVGILVQYGHPGEYTVASMQKLVELTAVSPSGKEQSWVRQLTQAGDALAAPVPASVPGIWIFAAHYDNGYFVKNKEGRYINTSKAEYPQGVESTHSVKFAKMIVQSGAGNGECSKPVGLRLELIPQVNPFSLKEGEELPVQVLYGGKALAGVGVEIGDGKTPVKEEEIKRYQTNAKGIAKVPIGKAGLQLVAVDYKFPSPQKSLADDESYSSTLTFLLR